jgi:hypothetical protein
VPLEPGPAGKPMLAAVELRPARGAAADGAPGFNLARSGGLALYAFLPPANARAVTGPATPDGPALGVDLERIDTDRRTLADLRRVRGVRDGKARDCGEERLALVAAAVAGGPPPALPGDAGDAVGTDG